MRGNLAQREPDRLAHWQAIDLYNKQRQISQGREKFILHDGPPYANGQLHMGHALNKTLKDMIIKSQQMLGKDAPYLPGWDCHGLPIELQVEKKHGKVGNKLTAREFRAACREYAEKQIDQQRQDFIRLGVFGEWDTPYKTMNYATEANIIRTLAKIVEKNHVVRGSKPVNWCMDCGSALAEAEVEYQNKQSYSIYVAYAAKDTVDLLARFGLTTDIFKTATETALDVIMWTTTPWTLPSSIGMSVHPELSYGLYQRQDGSAFVVADELVESVVSACDFGTYHRLATIDGQALDRAVLRHPFLERDILMMLGTHVTTEQGTGCVHTAPAHGVDDYQVAVLDYGLSFDSFVDGTGRFTESTPFFAGTKVFDANPAIVEKLIENQRLCAQSKFNHSYPHCWRHKTPTIFRATSQWFVGMDKAGLRQTALDGINTVKFIPEWGKARLYDMIENRPDWCISRQRYWGVPLCLLVHKETGELHPDTVSIMRQVADRVAQSGVDAWFDLSVEDLIGADAADYEKTQDILDVWFDSGSTHEAVLRAEPHLQFPADLYLEGSDQHRGWFHSSLLTSSAINGVPPYKALLTHGFVVDENGHKMSKSLGNIVEPQKIVGTLGADILRLWVASTDYTREIRLSDNILKQSADAYRRIRNTARFLLSNLHDFDPQVNWVSRDDMLEFDQYIVSRAAHVQTEIEQAYNHYQFHMVYQSIHHFCSLDLGGFYLDVIKDRQYTINADNIARRSAQTAMYLVLDALTRWIAPILPFTADEIWSFTPRVAADQGVESVFLTTFSNQLFTLAPSNRFDHAYWQTISQVREAVATELEKCRAAGEIGASLDAEVSIYAASELLNQLSQLGDALRFVLITSKVTLLPLTNLDADANPLISHIDGQQFAIIAQKSQAKKCARCWHYREDVGTHAEHPALCGRCVDNVSGRGEVRQFV